MAKRSHTTSSSAAASPHPVPPPLAMHPPIHPSSTHSPHCTPPTCFSGSQEHSMMRMSYVSGSSPSGNSTRAPGRNTGGRQVGQVPVMMAAGAACCKVCTKAGRAATARSVVASRTPLNTTTPPASPPRTLQLVVSRPLALRQRLAPPRLQQLQQPAPLRVLAQPEVHAVHVRKLPLEQLLARARHVRVLGARRAGGGVEVRQQMCSAQWLRSRGLAV